MRPGSLVLFGAHLAGQFVLDTVLVVAARTPYTLGRVGELPRPVSPVFRVATLEPLADHTGAGGRSAQLYRGVMHRDGGHERMFSFAPARVDGARFPRPALPRSRFVNPDMTQGFKITTVSAEMIQALWDEVVGQVRDQDLDLAIHLAEPDLLPRDPADRAIRSTATATGCIGADPVPAGCTPATAAKPPC